MHWLKSEDIQSKQFEYFKNTTELLNIFTYKYFITPPWFHYCRCVFHFPCKHKMQDSRVQTCLETINKNFQARLDAVLYEPQQDVFNGNYSSPSRHVLCSDRVQTRLKHFCDHVQTRLNSELCLNAFAFQKIFINRLVNVFRQCSILKDVRMQKNVALKT